MPENDVTTPAVLPPDLRVAVRGGRVSADPASVVIDDSAGVCALSYTRRNGNGIPAFGSAKVGRLHGALQSVRSIAWVRPRRLFPQSVWGRSYSTRKCVRMSGAA